MRAHVTNVGEIRRADELGYKGSGKFVWDMCHDCNKERWVHLKRGIPEHTRCSSCSNRITSTGRCRYEETRHRISIARQGMKFTDEHKANLSAYRTGKYGGDKHPGWKGGPITLKCLECGKEYTVSRYQALSGRSKFCSHSCTIIHNRKQGNFNIYPNKPEQRLIDILNHNQLPFEYVGDGEVWLGNHNPDFINVNGWKQVIELFGTYWHPVFDVAKYIEYYKQYGYMCLPIWEDELLNPDKVIKKVKKFCRF